MILWYVSLERAMHIFNILDHEFDISSPYNVVHHSSCQWAAQNTSSPVFTSIFHYLSMLIANLFLLKACCVLLVHLSVHSGKSLSIFRALSYLFLYSTRLWCFSFSLSGVFSIVCMNCSYFLTLLSSSPLTVLLLLCLIHLMPACYM